MKYPALDLPIHPSLTHPLTGLPLQAAGFRANGSPIWPILGASGDGDGDGGGDGSAGDSGGDGDGGEGGAGDAGKPNADDGNKKPDGYPEGKSIADMTDAEKAIFFEHKSRVEENRRKELLRTTGGKYGDALKAELEELETLRKAQMTDNEKAIDEAKASTRAEVAAEYTQKLVAAEFRAALAHVDEERREQIVEGVALDKFLNSDGDVDTAKVKAHVTAIAPSDQGTGHRDYGGGRNNGGGSTASGVNAGAEMFANRRKKSTTS